MARARVYVAGAYSASDVISVFGNMRRGMHLAKEVLDAGMAPFCPWFDYHFSLLGKVKLEDYYCYSLAWLEASEAVLVVRDGAENSKGTQHEIKVAKKLGIPVFYDLDALVLWRNTRG